jgi:hypothetical protein
VCWIGVDLGSEGDDGLDGIRREVINETGGHSWAWLGLGICGWAFQVLGPTFIYLLSPSGA